MDSRIATYGERLGKRRIYSDMAGLPQIEEKPRRMKTIATGQLAKVMDRLDQLIKLGSHTLCPGGGRVLDGQYIQWRLASMSFLRMVLPGHLYQKTFEDRVSTGPCTENVEVGLGILCAVQDEIGFGPLPQIEGLISGEIFDDFLEMAEHLLEKHYTEVVPSLVGAVLEDALRRIAKAHDIPVKSDSDNIASLNQKLADASVYSNLTRKKVVLWNGIRDNADHGKFTENTEQDVRSMLEGVRDFLNNYLA